MRFSKRQTVGPNRRISPMRLVTTWLSGALAVTLSACGGSANIPTATASGPQVYMSPAIAGLPASGNSATASLATYSIDDAKKTFAEMTYQFSDTQSGGQVQFSGKLCPNSSDSQCPSAAVFQRGFLDLELTYACGQGTVFGCTGVSYDPPQSGWALELAGQAGGMAQLQGQPFAPMVAAVSCPTITAPQTFLFVTLPNQLNPGSLQIATGQWNPQTETAYGSVDISVSGSTITLGNITQHTLPSSGGSGAPVNPSEPSITGTCSSTPYGNTVSIPAQVTITNPGNSQTVTPQALLGVGPSGLMVENNGNGSTGSVQPPFYQNSLGAGTGAIGLPKPSSAVDMNALTGAQYLGFFYSGGSSSSNWSSSPASFGFSSRPASCTSIAPQTSTMLYGGDFPNNNPATSTTGFGNCDFAIDLAAQDSHNNGLFTGATVYVGAGFCPSNGSATCTPVAQPYHFSAVAIAGQLNGKYAIFVIGVNKVGSPNQAWGIYLLQSN